MSKSVEKAVLEQMLYAAAGITAAHARCLHQSVGERLSHG